MTEALAFAVAVLLAACLWAGIAGLLRRGASRRREAGTAQAASGAVDEVIAASASAVLQTYDDRLDDLEQASTDALRAAELARAKRGRR